MEKYMATCRLILLTESLTQIISPVRSRCLCIRIGAPTIEEIAKVLSDVAYMEQFELPNDLAYEISNKSNRNLRRALLMLQTTKTKSFTDNKPLSTMSFIFTPEWERAIDNIANMALEEPSPKRLKLLREKVNELLVACIPSDLIFRRLTDKLVNKVDNVLNAEFARCAAFHQHRCKQGSKDIMHIEAFLARIMAL